MAIVLPSQDQCNFCGCTAFDPCMGLFGPCTWVEPGVCSACATDDEDLDRSEGEQLDDRATSTLPGLEDW